MGIAIATDTIISVPAGVVSANMDGEMVILNLTSGIYYGLDDVGARIWSLIEQPRSVTAIHEALLAEYDVEPDVCLQDLKDLLGNLLNSQLIEISTP